MPFNERGEWVNIDPYEEYKTRVIKSKEQPGSGGFIWSSGLRNKMHDEATRFVMELEGIPDTPDNFLTLRQRIGLEVENEFDSLERQGIIRQGVPPEVSAVPYYRRVGD